MKRRRERNLERLHGLGIKNSVLSVSFTNMEKMGGECVWVEMKVRVGINFYFCCDMPIRYSSRGDDEQNIDTKIKCMSIH